MHHKPSIPHSYFLPSLTFILSYFLLFNLPTTTTTATSNLIQHHQMCDHHDWVNFAMADDSIVADLLLRLNRRQPQPSLQLHWTVRQRRSRSLPKHAAKPDSTRISPTTPLSWNGATSPSEESSLPAKFAETSKSNTMVADPKETVTTTKSKRKKTLAELKEEESLLLKERRNLKNELVSLRLTVEKERATNESLKRMKFDFESQQKSNTAITSEVYGNIVYSHPSNSPVSATNASQKVQEIGNQEPKYVLPDLNLLVDEDLSSNMVHCIS